LTLATTDPNIGVVLVGRRADRGNMSGIGVLGIDNVLFDVGDLEAARRFYGELLGLEEKFAFPRIGLVCFRLGDEEPGLLVRASGAEPGAPRPSPRLWLEVPNARAAAAMLGDAGVGLLDEPRELRTGWVVELADPWGNVIGLADYLNDPARARPAPNGQ
jgi:predicted enzyme related to lactoylglutathione lyase